MVAASPPCNTFSRARWANNKGPPPLRMKHCPRGFPWLKGPLLEAARQSNELVDFTFFAQQAQLEHHDSMTLLEHPEDLGAVCRNMPGTMWDFEAARDMMARSDVTTSALYQSDFGVPYAKPTRLMGRMRGLENVVKVGPPVFDKSGKHLGAL